MLNLNLSKPAKKFLTKLPAKQFRQLDKELQELRTNPLPYVVPKANKSDARADQGEYRMIYRFDDKTFFVYAFTR